MLIAFLCIYIQKREGVLDSTTAAQKPEQAFLPQTSLLCPFFSRNIVFFFFLLFLCSWRTPPDSLFSCKNSSKSKPPIQTVRSLSLNPSPFPRPSLVRGEVWEISVVISSNLASLAALRADGWTDHGIKLPKREELIYIQILTELVIIQHVPSLLLLITTLLFLLIKVTLVCSQFFNMKSHLINN